MSATILFALVALDCFVWYEIAFARGSAAPAVYFLDVGQGDAELLRWGSSKILLDAGPDQRVVRSLEKVLPEGDRYLDLAILSHLQLDHFGGFLSLVDRYRIGTFVFNGRMDSPAKEEWQALTEKLVRRGVPLVVLGAGDRVRYGVDELRVLSPDRELIKSGEPNDTGFVMLAQTPEFRTLLTADIGENVERYLLAKGAELRADVLKVAHHGSKYSTSAAFLDVVRPRLAVIEVGKGNLYKHPTEEALNRLSSAVARVFETDRDGTVAVRAEGGALRVFTGL